MKKIEQVDLAHTEIQEYDPLWVEKYTKEAEGIKKLLGEKINSIEHIGSTSIPELASKPIIDIAVSVSSWKNVEDLIEPLSSLRYKPDIDKINETNAGERWFFRKGNPTEFHLSITYEDRGSFLERQILFRDYLRNNKEDRDNYALLKKDLLKQDPAGLNSYIENKTDFVMRILKKAGFQNKWFDLSKY